jgi:hypothetical protein
MRLYLKLVVILAVTVGAQWALKHAPAQGAELWFAARCQFAHLTHDDALWERLIRECQQLDCDAPDPVIVNAGRPTD